MRISLKEPLTPEQQKLWDQMLAIDTTRSALGHPIPLDLEDPTMLEIGRRRVAEIERAEIERLDVVHAALARRLQDLEALK